jgi:hypothetical protein
MRIEPTTVFVRNFESYQVGEQPGKPPSIYGKKLSPEQLRLLRLKQWKERKLGELNRGVEEAVFERNLVRRRSQ